jgi:hypothetical protein
MAQPTDFPARGKVIKVNSDSVVFAPANTNYELLLQTPVRYDGPVGQPIHVFIRAKARKVYTVPSGGGFVAPIFGPPRIVQGRTLFVSDTILVIRAGVPIIVEIPKNDLAIDLDDGAIALGNMVNATIFPGVTFELAGAPAVQKV